MAYYLVFVPEDQEATLEEFYSKAEVATRMRALVNVDGCAYIFCGERLHISRDKETKQVFILEEGHVPMPVLVPGRAEVILDGRLGSARELDPGYLAATKSAHPGSKNSKWAGGKSAEDDDDDDDDDEEDDDEL
jgi:hypothetical protein